MAGGRQGEENVTFSTCVPWFLGGTSVTTSAVTKGRVSRLINTQSIYNFWCFHSLTATTHAPALPTHRGATWKVKKKRQHKNQSQLDMKG